MYVSVFFFRRWFVTLYFKNPINNIKTEFTTFRVTKENSYYKVDKYYQEKKIRVC
jgi:hypothetical protein